MSGADSGEGLAREALELLQGLIRSDTVNPPGREREAQESLAAVLSEAGFRCELFAADPERPNLVARLGPDGAGASPAGSGPPQAGPGPRQVGPGGGAPRLCFLGHVDTVLADSSEWTHGPWSGDVADGFLWGRGALDMKSQVAAEVAAAASLARAGWRPARGELLVVAVVDEETGGRQGAEWLTRSHPEEVRCEMLVNEGAGAVFEYRGVRYYGVCCAEKGVFRFDVMTQGVAAHASMPRMGTNALLGMAPLLERMAVRQPAYELTAAPSAFLEALGEDPNEPARALAALAAQDERLGTIFEPMLGVTFSPTRIHASEKINVIPSSCEVRVDCRVPPGLGEEAVRRAIAEVLGPEEGFRIEFTEQVQGNDSPMQSPLMDAIAAWIAAKDPGAQIVPVVLPGFTDSRHFRAAFPECAAYGFFPHSHQSLLETAPLVHGADERIDLRDLAFASEFYRDLALRILG